MTSTLDRERSAERPVCLGGRGGERQRVDRFVGLLHLLGNSRKDWEAIEASELLLATKAGVQDLEREGGCDAKDEAGEDAARDAQNGPGTRLGRRAASLPSGR